MVLILINNGIDTNSKDNYNQTTLSFAAYHGHLQCMELLLARGADVNSRNNDNQTALHRTVFGYEACVSSLLNKD